MQQQTDVPRREYERQYLISLPVLPANFILFCVIYQCRSSKTVWMTREMNASSTAAQLCRSGHDYERWCNHSGLGIMIQSFSQNLISYQWCHFYPPADVAFNVQHALFHITKPSASNMMMAKKRNKSNKVMHKHRWFKKKVKG